MLGGMFGLGQQQPQQGQPAPQQGQQQPVLGGLFGNDMMPFYAALAFGADKQQQGRMAAEALAQRNQLNQNQSQFDARQALARQEMAALERYRQAQLGQRGRALDLEAQRFDLQRQKFEEGRGNPFIKSLRQIEEIPDTMLGGPEAAPIIRQRMVNGILGIEEEGRTLDEIVKGETALRKEINSLPQVKQANDALAAYNRIVQAAGTDSGPGDVALIFNYMKMLDPQSVVREGEFATAENAGGIGQRIRSLYNRVVDGERLTQDMRRQFLEAANNQLNVYTDALRTVRERYTPIADQYGFDRGRVLPPERDIQRLDPRAIMERYGVD